MSTPEDREWDAHQDRIVDDREAHGAYDDEGPAPCRECDGAGVVEVESADEDRDWTACGCQAEPAPERCLRCGLPLTAHGSTCPDNYDPAPVGETREQIKAEAWNEGFHAGRTQQQEVQRFAHWSHIGADYPSAFLNPYRIAAKP